MIQSLSGISGNIYGKRIIFAPENKDSGNHEDNNYHKGHQVQR